MAGATDAGEYHNRLPSLLSAKNARLANTNAGSNPPTFVTEKSAALRPDKYTQPVPHVAGQQDLRRQSA